MAEMMDRLKRIAGSQLGAQQQQKKQAYKPTEVKHSFDSAPKQQNGTAYKGTHNIEFKGNKDNGAKSLAEQKQDSIARTRQYESGMQSNSKYGNPHNLVNADRYNANPLLRGVIDASERAMNRTVIPQANIRNARKLFDSLSQDQYRRGNVATAQDRNDMLANQFARTHDLEMQKQVYANSKGKKTAKPSDIKTRGVLFDEMAMGQYGENFADFDEDTKAKAKKYYMLNGEFPSISPVVEKGTLWDSTSYVVNEPTSAKQQRAGRNTGQNTSFKNDPEYEQFRIEEARKKHQSIMNRDEVIPKTWYDKDLASDSSYL